MTKAEMARVSSPQEIPGAIEELARKYPNALGLDHSITRDGPYYVISAVFALPDPEPVTNGKRDALIEPAYKLRARTNSR